MKKFLLPFFCVSVLFSCKQSPSPKETAQTFIRSLSAADFTTASSLVSSATKGHLDKAKKESKSLHSPDDAFQLPSLSETINGNSAEVKNDVLSLSMVKEEDSWKVVLNEDLLNNLQQRKELLSAVKAKWIALRSEYDARLKVAKAYVDYKKSSGSPSPKVLALTEMVYNFGADSVRTKEALLAYLQKQQQLGQTIDAAMEPSLAANTDLSLQYILQMSTAADRIKEAEAEYQAIAQKAHSPVYVPLPGAMANNLKLKQN